MKRLSQIRGSWLALVAPGLVAATVWGGVCNSADACGGTFCDAGPSVMPVDQTGENVMFVVGEGQVEAHVQIQYTGDPERFAWVVPVMAVPTVEVGSDLLFRELLRSTVPTFTVANRSENCGGGGRSGSGMGCGSLVESVAGFSDEDVPSEDDEPDVRGRDVVGSYEYVVLDGGTVDGVVKWLNDNGFAQDEDAPPILQDYLDEGFMFVAFKLRAGIGIDQIHPVVLRYAGTEACVPLRLTRIAAREDMGVRAFFLGRDRVVPTNFRHVQLEPLKLDWVNTGSNYEEVVSLAVDENGSDGQGFITEYAGTSDTVATGAISSSQWSSEPFATVTPETLTDLLAAHDLMDCTRGACFPTHPLVPSMLQAYVPPPPGVDPALFYECSSCYADSFADEIDATTGGETTGGETTGGETTGGETTGGETTGGESTGGNVEEPSAAPGSWDTEGLAQAIEERIVVPGQHALLLLRKHPYLTRLYTTISPAEMTRDPLFAELGGLPEVSNVWEATLFNRCEGPDRVELKDGTVVWFTEDDEPPAFDGMPHARIIEEFFNAGPMVLRDNSEANDAELAAWNDEHAGAPAIADDMRSNDDSEDGGCGCASTRGLRGSAILTMLLLFGLRSRKPRKFCGAGHGSARPSLRSERDQAPRKQPRSALRPIGR